MKKYFFVVSVAATLFSCSNDQPESDPSIVPAAKTVSTTENINTVPVSSNPGVNTPTTITPQTVSSVQPQQQTVSAGSTVTSNAGINPAHGQPGHRCDISVGAPLNSATNNPRTPVTPTQTVTAAPPVVTAPGMNPPHGQPGHRCDISVGAPLNSAPTKPAAATQTITPAAIQSEEREKQKEKVQTAPQK